MRAWTRPSSTSRHSQDCARLARVLADVWGFAESSAVVPPDLLRALAHSGAYVAGVVVDGQVIGGGFAWPAHVDGEWRLHSHVIGFLDGYRAVGLGRADQAASARLRPGPRHGRRSSGPTTRCTPATPGSTSSSSALGCSASTTTSTARPRTRSASVSGPIGSSSAGESTTNRQRLDDGTTDRRSFTSERTANRSSSRRRRDGSERRSHRTSSACARPTRRRRSRGARRSREPSAAQIIDGANRRRYGRLARHPDRHRSEAGQRFGVRWAHGCACSSWLATRMSTSSRP